MDFEIRPHFCPVLRAVVRDEIALTEAQIENIGIAAVAATALAPSSVASVTGLGRAGPIRDFSFSAPCP